MDKKTVFVKTSKGESEARDKGGALSGDLKRALFLVDDKSTFEEILKRAAPSLREVLPDVFSQLEAGGYLRDKAKPFAEPQIVMPKIIAPGSSGELDFTGFASAPVQKSVATDADAARARAELEAAVEAAKMKARAEAEAKAEANIKLASELAARSKAEAEIRAKQDMLVREQAGAKAKQEAEARARAEQAAAQAKQQLEIAAREKAEAEARARQVAEAAGLKAEQEAARVKAELEAAAKTRQEAEAVRLKAEQEAARVKAEQEAAKVKAEAEARALAAERARQEAEAVRLKAEQEAARVKAEQEAAKVKAEAEARALAAERARQEAEAVRLKAEQEAARVKAEQDAAKVKAEAEARVLAEERARQEAEAVHFKAEQEAARVKAEAEARALERARKEAEAVRVKAEQEAVRVKAELEVAKAKVEAEVRALAEQRARQEAEAVRLKIEQDAQREKAEAAAKRASQPQATQEQEALRAAESERMKSAQVKLAAEQAEQEAAAQRANQEARKLAEEQAKTWAAAEQRAKAQAKVEAERPSQPAAASPAKPAPQKIASARRKPLPLGKIAAGLFVLVLLSIVLLPYVMPLSSYVTPLEQKLSAQFKQPVHVGNLRAASLPWPKLQLEKVTVGGAQELKVGNVEVTFDLFSLFSPVKVIRRVELQDITLEAASLDKELSWLQQIGANANYPVAHVTVQRAKVSSEEISLPVFSGELDINEQGKVSKVTLKSADAKFDVALQPVQDRWQIVLNAKETSFPLFPNVLFNDLSAKGEIGATGVNFVAIEGQAYGGFLNGNAKLNWQKGWQLQGRIEARTIELNKLFPKFGVTGELAGASNFVSSGLKPGKLADAAQMDGTLVVKKGVINGMDMVETARQGSRQNGSGGRTHFDELTGSFQANGRGQSFQQLKISSGILNGSGYFDVNGSGQISGHLSVELKARAGASSLALSGALTEPVLRAAR